MTQYLRLANPFQ